MIKIKKLVFSAFVAISPLCGLQAAQVSYSTPSNFQVLSMSPNGQWACGVFLDGASNTYGFRWNLNTGNIEMLSSTDTSMAWDVANDGTVSGNFADTSVTPNHAPVQMPGFYRDGQWHSVELPAEGVIDGLGYGITPDGHYMSGSVEIDGMYTPCIWHEGKLERVLPSDNHAMPYAISPDGKSAAGWIMQYNRTACYWPAEGGAKMFLDSPTHSYFMYNCGKNFSPDGKTLLYWGGWDLKANQDLFLWSLYDVENDVTKCIKAPSVSSAMEFFDISNDGVVVGSETGRGYVYVSNEDKSYYIDEYLEKVGADMDELKKFLYEGELITDGTLPITRVASISEDSKTIIFLYWDKNQLQSSMVLKLDVDNEKSLPAEVKAAQLSGLNNVSVTWKTPNGMQGESYMVYRDGKRISGMLPLRNTYYYDKNVAAGSHEYTVELIAPGGTRNMSDPVKVDVKDPTPARPMSLYVRQKSVCGAHLNWMAPIGNKVLMTYADYENATPLAFYVNENMRMEAAIKFDAHEISNYNGYRLDEVAFVPMAIQESWTVNIYSQSTSDGSLTLLASQPVTQDLIVGERNTVVLDAPVQLPVSGNLLVAVSVDTAGESSSVLGAEMGPVKAGYTDLLRKGGEDGFFSAYDSSLESGYTCTCMTWMIDASFAKDDYSVADNAVTGYNIYVDGEAVSNTSDTSAEIKSLSDGLHTLGVQAVYAGGRMSEISAADINIASRYPGVDNVEVSIVGDKDIKATWSAPVDNDLTSISYTSQTYATRGIAGDSSNGYALMAASDYPAAMFNGYEGYRFKSLKFYPLTEAVFSLILYQDGEEISYMEVKDYKLGEWNEIDLEEEIFVKKGSSYRFVVDCFDPTPKEEVIAVDDNPCFPMVSDLYSINNGDSFSSVSIDTSLNGNWMMGINLVSPEDITMDIAGYDVRIDGNLINESKITDTECEYTLNAKDDLRHSINIDTYYVGSEKAVSGSANYFTLSTGGIADGIVSEITLKEGENFLVAEGEGVKSISVVSVAGVQVAHAMGDKVSISSLAPGVYIVNILLDNGQTVSRKISLH